MAYSTADYANPPAAPDYFVDYLNQAEVQNALGVNINYTRTSSQYVGQGFAATGDFVYRMFLEDLEEILNNDVRVALIYGDADFIFRYFLTVSESRSLTECRQLVRRRRGLQADQLYRRGILPRGRLPAFHGRRRGVRRGSRVRQIQLHAGLPGGPRRYDELCTKHAKGRADNSPVPYYQPKASLELFRRVPGNLIIADGNEAVTKDYSTEGDAEATHTESFVPLPTASASASGGCSVDDIRAVVRA